MPANITTREPTQPRASATAYAIWTKALSSWAMQTIASPRREPRCQCRKAAEGGRLALEAADSIDPEPTSRPLRRCRSMEPIPNEREDVAHCAADEERDDNQRGRSHKIKRPNRQSQMDHVRPQNEIIERLPPIQSYQKRPNHMPCAEKYSDGECRFGWTQMLHRRCLSPSR
jgi:hypothetical protein